MVTSPKVEMKQEMGTRSSRARGELLSRVISPDNLKR